MTRLRRVYFKNAVYHVTLRGNNKQGILGTDEDKKSFLSSLSKFKSRFGFKLHGFVLMNNHAHLVIAAELIANISKIMQAVALSYSVKFSRKYSYSGHVWQGRFRSNVIENEKYALKCINYIHNNPVRAGLVKKPGDYFWSSYHFYNGDPDKLKDYIEIDRISI
jgi:REP element-mobilizing transposase RayT